MLLVAACIFPAFLLAGILISYDYQLTRENFIRSAMATARANAMEVDKEFAIVESSLFALSTSPSFMAHDLAALHAQASELSIKQNMFNVVLEDAEGRQVMNTVMPTGQALPPEPDQLALKALRENRATYISNLFTGRLSGRQIVSIGIPVQYGGGLNVLSGTVTVERFGEILQHQNYPEHWVTSILDRSGKIVARSADMQRYVGALAIPDVLQRMREQPEGSFETATLDGKPILAVLARAQYSGWTVAIGIPLQVLRTQTVGKLWLLVLATIVTLGAGLVFAWIIGTKIRRAMKGLIPPALALGSGGEVKSANYGLREANEVGLALAKASDMLHAATHQAHHDALTGIANRVMLHAFLDRQLAACERTGASLGLLYLDLDGFKQINDTHGHAAGDELLRQAASRLSSHIRKADMAARMGGDEFAVVLVNSGGAETEKVVAMLEAVMEQPYDIGGLSLIAAASIGSAIYPRGGSTSELLLAMADQSMYEHKSRRKKSPLPEQSDASG
jgi:diguanylate cyclase (GGDEF)-like protein